MSERQYEESDTQPIKLPRLRRETFRELPPAPVHSQWSPEAARPTESIFASVDPQNPTSLRHFQSLGIGEKFHIPSQAYDDEGNAIPDAVYLAEYRVKSLSNRGGETSALIVNSAGIEDIIPANIAPNKAEFDFEAKLLQSLENVNGFDIHNATQLIVEDTSRKK